MYLNLLLKNCLGDAARGATWVALHNGGGVGWGEVGIVSRILRRFHVSVGNEWGVWTCTGRLG